MKMHKLEVYVLDFEDYGPASIIAQFDQIDYTIIKDVKTTEIGEWSDDHELNKASTTIEDFRKYFRTEK